MVAPGVQFLLDSAITIAPLLVLHAGLVLLISRAYAWDVSQSVSLAVFGLSFTVPGYILTRSAYIHLMHIREARKLGARLVPNVKGWLPGNFDIFYNTFMEKDHYLADSVTLWNETYGTTFALTTLGETRIITLNPENLKRILTLDFDNYVKGTSFNSTMESVLGVGVFNSDGEMWQFHRKITRPFFARERVTDFRIFDSKSRLAIRRMMKQFEDGGAVDFQDVCSRFTLDSACEFLLGTSVNSLDAPLLNSGREEDSENLSDASSRFAKAFANAQLTVSSRGRLGGFWRLKEFFRDRTKDDMTVIKGFIDPIVKAALQKHEVNNGNENKEDSLLEHLLDVTTDMKIIVDEVLNIMLAGRDTTASLLTFVTYCLSMHPEVLLRLREEIASTIGSDGAPTLDDLRSMKYLRAVINETLRLYSPVPFNVRQTINATTWVDDEGRKLYIPPRTRVTFSYLHMHRHQAYWGPDAHLFDPDRWLDERLRKYVTQNPFVFLPFNAGPRICLGQQFAYHEASFFLVRLLQRFDTIDLAPDLQPMVSKPPAKWAEEPGSPRKKMEKCYPKSHLTLFLNGGLWLRMKEGKQEAV